MINILCITSPRTTGLNYHRQLTPFKYIGEGFAVMESKIWSDEFEDEFLKQFQVVSFLRLISADGKTKDIVDRLHSLGIKVHFDIDDYWVLPTKHPLYANFKSGNIAEQTVEALKLADVVTTTTDVLATKLKVHNDNVHVLPNAIHPEEEQWKITETSNELVRFGYIAGVHHVQDVELLVPSINKVWKDRELYGKFQFAPAGFNLNKEPNGKQWMNVYYKYVEQCFTDNYKHIKDKQYLRYLHDNNPSENENTFDRPYRRLWGLDTFNYAKLYDLIDVSLVPLHETMFSSCKSELKLIEAGFKKKACIVSNIRPYAGIATDENSLLVNPNRNDIDWFVSMRKLIKNPEMIKDLGEALYETVKSKYDIRNVNVERRQIFQRLCE